MCFMKPRNYHQLAIIRREAKGNTTVLLSKKHYSRKVKHKKQSVELSK